MRPDEYISRWVHGAGEIDRAAQDPVLLEIGRRRDVALKFNGAQRALPVALDESLSALIQESYYRELADARAIAAALPVLGRSDWEIPPVARYVLIAREEPDEHWVPGARSALDWAEVASPSGENECHVMFTEGITRDVHMLGTIWEPGESELERVFSLDNSAVLRSESSVLHHGVARLLGYVEADLDFRDG
jgi:hypothetical protein